MKNLVSNIGRGIGLILVSAFIALAAGGGQSANAATAAWQNERVATQQPPPPANQTAAIVHNDVSGAEAIEYGQIAAAPNQSRLTACGAAPRGGKQSVAGQLAQNRASLAALAKKAEAD